MRLIIGSDHAGYSMKEYLKSKLVSYEVLDLGAYSAERANYPDFAHAVADTVERDNTVLGILICGSANGVAMTANKHQGIRCAIAWNEELAKLARQHNDANIIALPARFVDNDEALRILETFLSAEFEGGRHEERVSGIPCKA